MLTSLYISNFRGFGRPADIPLRPLTLLYGPNSGGKSSILKALLLLRQNIDLGHEFRFEGNFVSLGSYSRSVYRHDPKGVINIGWSIKGRPEQIRLVFLDHENSYLVSIKDEDQGNCATILCSLGDTMTEVKFGTGRLVVRGFIRSGKWDEREIAANEIENLPTHRPDYEQNLVNQMRRGERLLPQISVFLESVEETSPYGPSSGDLGTEVELFSGRLPWQIYFGLHAIQEILASSDTILRGVVQVGPLRPPPTLLYDGPPPWAATKEVQSRIADLVAKLGIGYQLSIEPVADSDLPFAHKVMLRDMAGTAHGLGEVGFGVSQLLPILGECVSRKKALICIQQPEEHLHPRLQAELGEALARIAKDSDLDNQLIVESHSETLILRVMRLVRERVLTPQDVAVIYVQSTDAGSEAFELRLDDDGNFLDPWPGGFFEEGFRERFS